MGWNPSKKPRVKLNDIYEERPDVNKLLGGRGSFKNRNEAEFWLCLVFQSNQQVRDFIANLPEGVGVLYNNYVDGEALAKILGIPVSEVEYPPAETYHNPRAAKIALTRKLLAQAKPLPKDKA